MYFGTRSVRWCVDLRKMNFCLSIEMKWVLLFVCSININIAVVLMYRMVLANEFVLSNCVVCLVYVDVMDNFINLWNCRCVA